MVILDITDWKQKGQELHDIIENECGYQNNSVLLGMLPSVIRMTPAQYQDLSRVSGVVGDLDESEGRFYYTKYNVMEVDVRKTLEGTWNQ